MYPTMYEAEFQSRRKLPTVDWPAFGEDLKTLSDKAFPDLEVAARECLAVTQFLWPVGSPAVFQCQTD